MIKGNKLYNLGRTGFYLGWLVFALTAATCETYRTIKKLTPSREEIRISEIKESNLETLADFNEYEGVLEKRGDYILGGSITTMLLSLFPIGIGIDNKRKRNQSYN